MDLWVAPNRIEVVERLAEQYPDMIRYRDLDFCVLVVTELNKENPGMWGLNGKRGNPNDKSRDCITWKNPNVPWGCSIIDIIGGHTDNSGAPVSAAWIDQTRKTHSLGTVGYFLSVDGTPNPTPKPTPVPVPNNDLTALNTKLDAILLGISQLKEIFEHVSNERQNVLEHVTTQATAVLSGVTSEANRVITDVKGSQSCRIKRNIPGLTT